jgi:hypothetical protein
MARLALSLLGSFLLLLAGVFPALAQDATPFDGLAESGLATLDVMVTATGYEGIPDSLEAGRYIVSLTAGEDTGEFGGGIAFVQPSGMTPDEFLGLLAGPPDQSGVGMASPVAETEASPAAEEGMGGPPAELFQSLFAGGTYAAPGSTAQVVLDLTPGSWLAWADDPEAAQEPVIFEVTGEMPADLVEPESSATLTMGEYVIEVTAGELAAGPQLLKVENIGAQPHFIFAALGPDDMTMEQVQVALDEEATAEMTGTPPAYSDLNPDEALRPAFNTGTQSLGTTTWVPVDLEAGMYLLICFFPDIADGIPHAYHGMYNVVEVGE